MEDGNNNIIQRQIRGGQKSVVKQQKNKFHTTKFLFDDGYQ